MIDKKEATIIIFLALLVITGFGWLNSLRESASDNTLPIPYDNTYSWAEFFRGYEAYLDRRIFYANAGGTSMEPTFGDGDVVLWVEVDPAELKIGDIIIYQHPTHPSVEIIAHRIIDITVDVVGYRFETKGDNRLESDAETVISAYYVREDDLKGLVIGVIYDAGPG